MKNYLWVLLSLPLAAAACSASPGPSEPGGAEPAAPSAEKTSQVSEQYRGGCTPHAVECTGCTRDSQSKTGYAKICGNGCSPPTATPCTPAIDSVTFAIHACDGDSYTTSAGFTGYDNYDTAKGSINVDDNGDWSVASGSVDIYSDQGGCFALTCNIPSSEQPILALTWQGCADFDYWSGNPTVNLTGSGNSPSVKANWATVAEYGTSAGADCSLIGNGHASVRCN
jgi:hypothetical protein